MRFTLISRATTTGQGGGNGLLDVVSRSICCFNGTRRTATNRAQSYIEVPQVCRVASLWASSFFSPRAAATQFTTSEFMV